MTDCRDLLRRFLTADPEQRITLQQVMQHAWISGSKFAIVINYTELFMQLFYTTFRRVISHRNCRTHAVTETTYKLIGLSL